MFCLVYLFASFESAFTLAADLVSILFYYYYHYHFFLLYINMDIFSYVASKSINANQVFQATHEPLERPSINTQFKQLRNVLNKQLRMWWDITTLEQYVSKSMVPQRLRWDMKIYEGYETDESEVFWKTFFNQCGLSLLEKLIERKKLRLQELDIEVQTLKGEMGSLEADPQFLSLSEDTKQKLAKDDLEIQQRKQRKFKRDLLDYEKGQVFKWSKSYIDRNQNNSVYQGSVHNSRPQLGGHYDNNNQETQRNHWNPVPCRNNYQTAGGFKNSGRGDFNNTNRKGGILHTPRPYNHRALWNTPRELHNNSVGNASGIPHPFQRGTRDPKGKNVTLRTTQPPDHQREPGTQGRRSPPVNLYQDHGKRPVGLSTGTIPKKIRYPEKREDGREPESTRNGENLRKGNPIGTTPGKRKRSNIDGEEEGGELNIKRGMRMGEQ